MYFLLDACQHPTVLRTIYFGLIIKDIIFTIIPIGIIVMTLIDFSKAVIASKEDEQQKAVKLIPKRIMYAIIVFAIPWIVTALMKALSSLKLSVAMDFQICVDNAKKAEGNFEYYDNLLAAEEKLEANTQANGSSNSGSNNSGTNGESSSISHNVANRYLDLVKAQLNNNYSKYGGSAGEHWCAFFVSWTLKNTKMDNGTSIWNYLQSKGSVGGGGHASSMWPAFKAINGWYRSKAYGGNYTPKPGDIIWFQWNPSYSRCRNSNGKWDGNKQCSDHVGVVEYVEGNTVHTIEGNVNGSGPATTVVSRRSYSLDSDTIVVYGAWYK